MMATSSPRSSTCVDASSRPTRSRSPSVSCLHWKSPLPARWFVLMRNVLVTGGSRGLGLGIAEALVSAGYRVIAVARTPSAGLTAAIEALEPASRDALRFRPFDLSEIAAIPDFVRALR